MKTLIAQEGKVFAYMEGDQEIILGNTLYLGVNDDGSRYYEVDEVVQEDELPRED